MSDAPDPRSTPDEPSILSSSAVMAAGTFFSRISGFLRSALLAAALGLGLHAELFQIANTVPNMLYILLAGGVFNAVLVPQLVRHMTHDADGGEAYTNRVITLAGLFLLVVTVLLVAAAPLVMSVLLNDQFDDPALAAQRDSAIDFARYCLPQVFFYGAFVLVGQILNARRRFGPMMWAPIANNVIAIAVLVSYLFVFGPATGPETQGAFDTGQEMLLGIGATAGIAVQFLILLPYLRAAGFRYRARFDLRDPELARTLRLGSWTIGFVVLNQLAYVAVTRLGSGGTAAGPEGTGLTVYANAFLVMMVPHSIVTVSLATAVLPRLSSLAGSGDVRGMVAPLLSTARTALAIVVPFAALLAVLAPEISRLLFGYGSAADTFDRVQQPLMLFAAALTMFTIHYLVLRGFYALEQTRTVFTVQVFVAATNVAVAYGLVSATDPAFTASALVLAYLSAYAVGSVVSFTVLGRRLGGWPVRELGGFGLRLGLATAVTAGVAWSVATALRSSTTVADSLVVSVGVAAVVGLVAAGSYVVVGRWIRLTEVGEITGLVTSRLRR